MIFQETTNSDIRTVLISGYHCWSLTHCFLKSTRLTFEQKTTQSMHNSLETSIIFLTGFEAMNK